MSPAAGPKTPEDRPDVFQVGTHAVRVSEVKKGRWAFAVDGGSLSEAFPTRAAAWAAGVRAAYLLDDP